MRLRGTRPWPPAALPFFILCQSVGFALGAAGDVYGPYWLVPLYFTAQCTTFASLVHLAISYPQPLGMGSPWRRLAIALLYGSAFALAFGLVGSGDEVSLFVPLLYVVYLLLANAIFLYLAGLATGFSFVADGRARAGLRWALGGILAVVLLPAMIFLVYPFLDQTISPLTLVAPLAAFPIATAIGLTRPGALEALRPASSVRLRLSLLFLGAVETSFLIAVAVFWQNQSWARLFDELSLHQRRIAAVERMIESGPSRDDAARLEVLAQTVPESDLARSVAEAVDRGDTATAQQDLAALLALYEQSRGRAEARRAWIAALGIPALGGLLLIAVAQAVAFTIAVRRWLIRPLERVAAATGVIATGDLAHRLEPEETDEFARLGRSVNSMAASLQAVQRRMEMARAARQRAAGAARDAERRRLARELHDGILQDLTAVRLKLESEGPGPTTPQAGRPVEAISGVLAALRAVVDDLRPPALSGVSLAEAIAGQARVLAWSQGVELALDLEAAERIPEWATRDVYRIAQEAIANALRHAAARHLAIRILEQESGPVLEVSDDGAGFAVDATPLGSGLQGMRERAAALGSDLEITSAPGHGTTIRLVLRLPPT